MKITNIKLNPVYTFSISNRLCGICQQSLNMTCGLCLHPSVCGPIYGKCGHVYHKHCFDNWYKLNKNCPICREDWISQLVYGESFNISLKKGGKKQIEKFGLDI
ncbi:Anaphase-promoting complex subunit 11 [Cucumispora dikerogammari]|nr:Anaphase-promoting complex subunit 11 [Cucumispora dikerogammari]